MAVPDSGVLSLLAIYNELAENDYDSGTSRTNVSLNNLSTGGNPPNQAINTDNDEANRPDGGTTNHAMSEFYSYDHNLVTATFDSVFSNFTMADVQGQTVISSAKAITISGGSGNTTVSVAGGSFGVIQVSLAASSGGPFSYSSTSDNISHSSGTKYAKFKWVVNHPLGGTGTESRTVTITNGNGASTTRTITATVQGE